MDTDTDRIETPTTNSAKLDLLILGQNIVQEDVKEVKAQLGVLNGTVRLNNDRLTKLETWRDLRGDPGALTAAQNKIELAKFGAFGGSLGLALGVVVAVLKAAGCM